jgi:cGMP-dependent protein kinase
MKKAGAQPSIPKSPRLSASSLSKSTSKLGLFKAEPKSEDSKGARADGRKVAKKKLPVEPRVAPDYTEAANAVVTERAKTDSDKELISAALSKHFIFVSLSPENQRVIIEVMKHYRMAAREVVFEQGKPAANFFILATGRLEVVVENRQVNIIKPGEGFGELALLHDTPRSATIRTIEPCSMWAVDGKTFRQFLQTVNSQNYVENKAFVNSVQIFASLTDEQRENLVNALTSQQFNSGQKIVNEGDPGELFYIIKDGTVSCTKGGIEIRRLSKGEFFGEQALLYGGTRTATITAVEGQVKCVAIGRHDLEQVLGNHLQHIIYRNTQRMAFERNDVLKRLNRDQTDRLIDNMVVRTYTNGQIVIPQGHPKGAKLWVVLKGALGPNGFRIEAETLACLGEQSLSEGATGAFAEALLAIGDQVHIAEIERAKFEECIGGGITQATVNNEALSVLKRVPLLRGLAPDRLPVLIQALLIREYRDSEVIVQQRSRGDMLFIVKSGKVEVVKDGVNIRTITKHDYFGERSVLFDEIRTATVVARGPVSCWTLQKSDFLVIINEDMRKGLMKRIELQDDTIGFANLVIVKTLGKGMFGNVFLTVNPEKGTLYALKTVSRRKIETYEIEENILLERRMLLQIDHPLIVKLIKTFKDSKRIYFLMEFVKGQDLFDVLRAMGLLNDADARFYVAGMILMMEHLHERDIIYRDLKPENVMIDEDGYPKLIDFGTAKIIQNRTYTIVGTPHYMAPEVIMGKGYGLVADIYSIGIILFEFVCGSVPFGEDEEDPYVVYEKVLEHRLIFPHFIDPRLPSRPIIEQLLNSNPAMRLGGSIDNFKAHRWFKGLDWV